MTLGATPPASIWLAPLGAILATPITVGGVSLAVFPYWAALTLFTSPALALPSLVSAIAIMIACHSANRRFNSAASFLVMGIVLGAIASVLWCLLLAGLQNWQLSFEVGDPRPGSPPPDRLDQALKAASFLITTGAVLGAWTALFSWLVLRTDRNKPNPTNSAP